MRLASSITDRIKSSNLVFGKEPIDLFQTNEQNWDKNEELNLKTKQRKWPCSEIIQLKGEEGQVGDFLEPERRVSNKNKDRRKVITDLSQLAEESSKSYSENGSEEDKFGMLNLEIKDSENSSENIHKKNESIVKYVDENLTQNTNADEEVNIKTNNNQEIRLELTPKMEPMGEREGSHEWMERSESLGLENRTDLLEFADGTESNETVKSATNIEELLQKLWKGWVFRESNQLLFQSETWSNGVQISCQDMLNSVGKLCENHETVEEVKELSLQAKPSEAKPLGGFNFEGLEDMGEIMDDDLNELEDDLDESFKNLGDIPYGN